MGGSRKASTRPIFAMREGKFTTQYSRTFVEAAQKIATIPRITPAQDEALDLLEHRACPGAGSCGGLYTANTMAAAFEGIGLSLPGVASIPAVDARRAEACRRTGEAALRMLREGIRPRDILTREAFENAIAVVMAFGGSTNAVLHLLAMAHEADVDLSLEGIVWSAFGTSGQRCTAASRERSVMSPFDVANARVPSSPTANAMTPALGSVSRPTTRSSPNARMPSAITSFARCGCVHSYGSRCARSSNAVRA